MAALTAAWLSVAHEVSAWLSVAQRVFSGAQPPGAQRLPVAPAGGEPVRKWDMRGPQHIFFPSGPLLVVFSIVRALPVSLCCPLEKCWAPALSINFPGSCRYSTPLRGDSWTSIGLRALCISQLLLEDQAWGEPLGKAMTSWRTHVLLWKKLKLSFFPKTTRATEAPGMLKH